MLLKDFLSDVHQKILPPQLINIAVPKERFATCENCHHCISKSSPLSKTKCCTYHPALPNFLVGAIIIDESPHMAIGKSRIEQRMNQRLGISPLGILPPLNKQLLREEHVKVETGVSSAATANELLCPFNNNGFCSIWRYRTENCVTFFCYSVGGKYGQSFWNTLYRYLNTIDQQLAIYALCQLGLPLEQLPSNELSAKNMGLDSTNGALNETVYEKSWGKWKGKEMQLYKECYSVIRSLSYTDVELILGEEGNSQSHIVKESLDLFNQFTIPKYLVLEDYSAFTPKGRTEFIVELIDKKIVINVVTYKIIQLFNGKTSTYEIIRKSAIIYQDISVLIIPLIKARILREVKT